MEAIDYVYGCLADVMVQTRKNGSVPREYLEALSQHIIEMVIDHGQYDEFDYPPCDCGCNDEEDHEDEHDDVWLAIDELWQRVEKLELGENVLSPHYHEY